MNNTLPPPEAWEAALQIVHGPYRFFPDDKPKPTTESIAVIIEAQYRHLRRDGERLRQLLSRYGRHDADCPLHVGPNQPGDPSCTCGFSGALLL